MQAPWPIRVDNTFISVGPKRSPSLDGFFRERLVRSCPGSRPSTPIHDSPRECPPLIQRSFIRIDAAKIAPDTLSSRATDVTECIHRLDPPCKSAASVRASFTGSDGEGSDTTMITSSSSTTYVKDCASMHDSPRGSAALLQASFIGKDAIKTLPDIISSRVTDKKEHSLLHALSDECAGFRLQPSFREGDTTKTTSDTISSSAACIKDSGPICSSCSDFGGFQENFLACAFCCTDESLRNSYAPSDASTRQPVSNTSINSSSVSCQSELEEQQIVVQESEPESPSSSERPQRKSVDELYIDSEEEDLPSIANGQVQRTELPKKSCDASGDVSSSIAPVLLADETCSGTSADTVARKDNGRHFHNSVAAFPKHHVFWGVFGIAIAAAVAIFSFNAMGFEPSIRGALRAENLGGVGWAGWKTEHEPHGVEVMGSLATNEQVAAAALHTAASAGIQTLLGRLEELEPSLRSEATFQEGQDFRRRFGELLQMVRAWSIGSKNDTYLDTFQAEFAAFIARAETEALIVNPALTSIQLLQSSLSGAPAEMEAPTAEPALKSMQLLQSSLSGGLAEAAEAPPIHEPALISIQSLQSSLSGLAGIPVQSREAYRSTNAKDVANLVYNQYPPVQSSPQALSGSGGDSKQHGFERTGEVRDALTLGFRMQRAFDNIVDSSKKYELLQPQLQHLNEALRWQVVRRGGQIDESLLMLQQRGSHIEFADDGSIVVPASVKDRYQYAVGFQASPADRSSDLWSSRQYLADLEAFVQTQVVFLRDIEEVVRQAVLR